MSAPPRPGSLQEALCILVQRYRREQQYYLALAGLHRENSKERQEMFDKYRDSMFPYIIRGAVDEKARVQEILEEAFAQGPIVIRPAKGDD